MKPFPALLLALAFLFVGCIFPGPLHDNGNTLKGEGDENVSVDENTGESIGEGQQVFSEPLKTELNEFEAPRPEIVVPDFSLPYITSCKADEDCTYVLDPPGMEKDSCVNLENLLAQNPDAEIVSPFPGVECVCRPIEMFLPQGGWVEDVGKTVCRRQEQRPDIAVKELEFFPEEAVSGDEMDFELTLRNIGFSGCSELLTTIEFGNGLGLEVISTWPGALDLTEEDTDLGLLFYPETDYSISCFVVYDSPGEYGIELSSYCIEPELEYFNNEYTTTVNVS